MTAPAERALTYGVLALSAALLVAAVAVRGRASPQEQLAPRPTTPTAIEDPMQLLGGGARYRLTLDWPHVPAELRSRWREVYPVLFELQGCPELSKWLQTPEGQGAEHLVRALTRGGTEERIGALALLFQLARATHWKPTLLGGAGDAVRLAGLLEEALSPWASAVPAGYEDPVLAALFLYGRAMRMAWKAPVIGSDEGSLQRARAFLQRFTGAGTPAATPVGRLLQRRYPRAWSSLAAKGDLLEGLSAEARLQMPGIDGECGS